MAENKKGFILYADLLKVVEQLPDDIAGKLFKIILTYVNDLEVQIDDLLLKIAFEPIKLQLKRDLKKFEVKKQQYSDAGKASAEARRLKRENEQVSTPLKDVEERSTNPTVIDTVNVTDKVIVKDIKKVFIPPTEKEFMVYAREQFSTDEEYKRSRKNLIFKYQAWNVDEWKDGNGKKISNWKAKLLHNLKYIIE